MKTLLKIVLTGILAVWIIEIVVVIPWLLYLTWADYRTEKRKREAPLRNKRGGVR
jgi:hypothetical protein